MGKHSSFIIDSVSAIDKITQSSRLLEAFAPIRIRLLSFKEKG